MQKPFRMIRLPVWIVIGIVLVLLVPVNFAASAQSATATNTPTTVASVSDTPTATATNTPITVTNIPGTPTASATNTPTTATNISETPTSDATPDVTATPQPMPRIYTITEEYEGVVWWVVSYEGYQVLCEVIVEYKGLPTSTDIIKSCGEEIFQVYQATESCAAAPSADAPSLPCDGVYLHWAKNFIGTREKTIAYPLPFVVLNVRGCISEKLGYRCDQLPSLEITAEEPNDDHTITSIEGRINGVDFTCNTNPCLVTLQETSGNGVRAEFWANSSSGTSSVPQTALIRVLPLSGTPSGAQSGRWTVEVASRLWQGAPGHSCSQYWETLPEVTGLPYWLSSPNEAEKLKTYTAYYYLAGALIRSGQVNVDGCPGRGMQTYLIPNTCGMLRATPLVEEWQNQFDQTIIKSAHRNNVPSMLIKNIFSRESQFWPGVYTMNNEVGLGQMTEGGADTLLMWNPVFFQKFCSEIFFPSVCSKGYFRLHPYEKSLMRGALLTKVNASCKDCPKKINLAQAEFSVDVFAASLVASCKQADQVIYNLTGKPSGLSASYVDLWRLTLVNYNAGAGCLEQAVSKTIAENAVINWENVSANLEPACQGAIKYVEDIANIRVPK